MDRSPLPPCLAFKHLLTFCIIWFVNAGSLFSHSAQSVNFCFYVFFFFFFYLSSAVHDLICLSLAYYAEYSRLPEISISQAIILLRT